MPFDRIGVMKAHLEGEDKFIIVEMDSELGKPFMQTSSALSKEGAAEELRRRGVPEAEIARLLAQDI